MKTWLMKTKELKNPCCNAADIRIEQYAAAIVELYDDGNFDIVATEQGDLDWDTVSCTGCDRLLDFARGENGKYQLIKRNFVAVAND
jgi:hypothetical protein